MKANNKLHAEESSILVICHNNEDFKNISEVLKHYFPNQENLQNLLISNKYYKAEVKLHSKLWTHVNSNQEAGQLTVNKYDLMIMLVNETQQNLINFESLDSVIETFNPEEFVLLVNTTTPEDSWVHEETILQKCNNFIEIVKEDLGKINKLRPVWSRGALLNNEEEADDSGIFSILDRMETTRWSTMVNVKKDMVNEKKEAVSDKLNIKFEPVTQQSNKTIKKQTETNKPQTESHLSQQNNQEKELAVQAKINKEKNSSSDEQTDEKRLEQEMREFENMMGQMMSFKMQSAGMKTQERKEKAQQLFFSMFKGMINNQEM